MYSNREFKHILKNQTKRNKQARLRAGIAGICLLASGFAAVKYVQRKNRPSPDVAGEVLTAETPAPLPSAIDDNFFRQINDCFLPAAKIYGFDLRITSGFRSIDEQDQLYEQGRTEDGHIVTDTPGGRSLHNYGFAIDVADRIDGFDIDWAKLGRIAAYCGIEQGVDGDLAHFEHRANLNRDDFAQGVRPPKLVLPCGIMEQRAAALQTLTKADLAACGAPDFNKQT